MCLPIVVLLVVATIEACSAVFLKQSLTVAAYEGVRTALVEGATASNVQAACNQILADRKIEGGTITVSPSDIAALGARRIRRRDGLRTLRRELRRARQLLPRTNACRPRRR